jgi:hypothetical protein
LASAARKRHRQTNAGSMSRPEHVRIELIDDVQVVIGIEFVGRQNTVFRARLEQRDWDHQGTGELEGVILSKN